MAKKNQKKGGKKKANKLAKKLQKKRPQKKLTSTKQPINNGKSLITTQTEVLQTETTFSKKLEEVIAANDGGKKGLFKGKIILLGGPSGYGDPDWSRLWKRFIRMTFHFFIIILLISVVCSAVVAVEVLSDQRIMPGIAFAQEDIGYQKLVDAQTEILKQLDEYQAGSLVFNYGDQSVSIPLRDLSITLQEDQTLSQLPFFNFQQNTFVDLIGSKLTQKAINPIFKEDDQQIFKLVENQLKLKDKRAKSAHFSLDDQKKLVVVAETPGVIINHSALINSIAQRVNTLSTEPIDVQTLLEIPTVNAAELAKSQSDLQVKLENQLIIKYNDKTWKFKPTEHLEDIDFRQDNSQVVIIMSPKLVENYLQKDIFSTIEKAASQVKIGYDDQGKVTFDGQVHNGLAVLKDQFVTDLNMAVNSLDQDVNIQTQEIKAGLEIDPQLQAIGIHDLIGVGHTSFTGSPTNRRWNIDIGMKKFNGLIIKPGETFSFNDNLGPVDASTGYRLELVIKAEGTVPDYGGGICQVSSTMFKSAIFSGLPIVERSPHSYAVSYYAQIDGYGLDSTIYPGVKDLKFTNNTPGSILIQSYLDGDHAYINFFGTSDGRKVEVTDYWRGNYRGAGGTKLIPTNTLPAGQKKQIEAAHGGFDASWNRIITTKDGQSTTEKIYSVYRATSNRFLVGQ